MAALSYKLIRHLDNHGTPVIELNFRKITAGDLPLLHAVTAMRGETAGSLALLACLCGLPDDVFSTMGAADMERLGEHYGELFD